MPAPPADPSSDKAISPSLRAAVLKTLGAIATTEASLQLDAFIARLSAALHALLEKESGGADLCLNAFRHLNKNKATFRRLLSSCLAEALQREIAALDASHDARMESGALDLSLASFEAMERKVLIDNLGQALANLSSTPLGALNARIAHLLQRDHADPAQNPFRPAVFLHAVAEAWSRFDLGNGGERVVLRQCEPEVFLRLDPILQALNEALIANGILPEFEARLQKPAARSEARISRRGLPLYRKLNQWLPEEEDEPVSPALLRYLDSLQRQTARRPSADRNAAAPADAAVIRDAKRQAPSGMLTRIDENATELLARIFDFVFRERHIPGQFKRLLGHLQIPVLKAALADKEFFYRDGHPARRLVDTVARVSVAWDEREGCDDRLYQVAEQLVERVQQEYERQIELFDHAAADLEAFAADEAQQADAALSQLVARARQQENIERSRELAAHDVALRIETGEVLDFVEEFLETQWIRALALARGMQDTKPEVLYKALEAMDELIWSVKPKTGAQERRELLTRLPALLSILNAWLNVLKWDGPERVKFFSMLAEHHAALARTKIELSARQQLEFRLDAVQRASERRLNIRAVEQPESNADDFMHLVDGLEPGMWIEFLRDGGAKAKVRLAWVSPRRSRFVFAGRRGQDGFVLKFDDMVQSFRGRRAQIVAADVVCDRAMAAVLDEL